MFPKNWTGIAYAYVLLQSLQACLLSINSLEMNLNKIQGLSENLSSIP